MKEIENIKVDRKTLAELFEVNEKYINELVDEYGMPKIDYNTYNLVDCFKWWIEHQKNILKKQIEKLKAMKPQDELALMSARLKELDVMEREGKLIELDLIKNAWMSEYKMLNELLIGLGPRLSTRLINKSDPIEVRKIIDEEVEKIKNAIVELPLPINQEEEDDENEESD